MFHQRHRVIAFVARARPALNQGPPERRQVAGAQFIDHIIRRERLAIAGAGPWKRLAIGIVGDVMFSPVQ